MSVADQVARSAERNVGHCEACRENLACEVEHVIEVDGHAYALCGACGRQAILEGCDCAPVKE